MGKSPEAQTLQMLFRLQKYDALQLYRHYNMGHPDWPNLPPPPNAEKLKSFVVWALNTSLEQMAEENDPKRRPAQR